MEEAKETVNGICAKYVEGYTVTEAQGGWVDETGTLTEEQTLVYSFTGVSEEALTSIMDEVLKELNQNSILWKPLMCTIAIITENNGGIIP